MTGWDWRDWAGWAGFNDGSVNGGSGNWSAGIWLTARQMARFGHLFLNRGNWAGQQLISASWVDQATSPQVAQNLPRGASSTDLNGPGNYGFNWWTSGVRSDGSRMWPAAPNGTYAAGGLNVNVCFVIPEWNMVIVRQGMSWRGDQIDPVLSTFLGKVGAALGTAPPPSGRRHELHAGECGYGSGSRGPGRRGRDRPDDAADPEPQCPSQYVSVARRERPICARQKRRDRERRAVHPGQRCGRQLQSLDPHRDVAHPHNNPLFRGRRYRSGRKLLDGPSPSPTAPPATASA